MQQLVKTGRYNTLTMPTTKQTKQQKGHCLLRNYRTQVFFIDTHSAILKQCERDSNPPTPASKPRTFHFSFSVASSRDIQFTLKLQFQM